MAISHIMTSIDMLAAGSDTGTALKTLCDAFNSLDVTAQDELGSSIASKILSTKGPMENLVLAMEHPDASLKGRAMSTVIILCLASAEFRAAISTPMYSKGLQNLIENAQASSIPSIVALAALANSPKTAQVAADAGALPALVHVMNERAAPEPTQVHAARALYNYMQASTTRTRQATSVGAIQPLARLAFSDTPLAQLSAAKALHRIFNTAREPTPEIPTKLVIAAMARLVVCGGREREGDLASTSDCAIGCLFDISKNDCCEGSWASPEVSKALACAKAGPSLLHSHAMGWSLLGRMLNRYPEHIAAVVEAGGIAKMKKMAARGDVADRGAAASVLLAIKLVGGRYSAMVGRNYDAKGIVEAAERDLIALEDECGRCALCGTAAADVGKKELARCSACRQVAYCSGKCQKAHWKVHKPDCV